LTAIAATVIGGTNLLGGRGSVFGAVVGSLLLGMLTNGLIIMGLAVPLQIMIQGFLIIVAVVVSLRDQHD